MALSLVIKNEVSSNIEKYEGRFNHLYLDTKGRVTVGVGHLVASRSAISSVPLYRIVNKIPTTIATIQERQAEYDNISKKPFGYQYSASAFKKYTTLVMKDADIDKQRDNHIQNFYSELCAIFNKRNGYPDEFDNLPKNVQLALFDMIFNLGAVKIVRLFPNFNLALKAGDWKRAAIESNRPDVSPARNQYVRQLLNSAPMAVTP